MGRLLPWWTWVNQDLPAIGAVAGGWCENRSCALVVDGLGMTVYQTQFCAASSGMASAGIADAGCLPLLSETSVSSNIGIPSTRRQGRGCHTEYVSHLNPKPAATGSDDTSAHQIQQVSCSRKLSSAISTVAQDSSPLRFHGGLWTWQSVVVQVLPEIPLQCPAASVPLSGPLPQSRAEPRVCEA